MSNIELKPCPFCGGEAGLAYAPSNEFAGIPCYAVACKHCKVMMGTVREGRTDFYRTQQEAIEIWNTRKPMEQIVEQLNSRYLKHDINAESKMSWDIECCNSHNNGITEAIEIVRKGGAE